MTEIRKPDPIRIDSEKTRFKEHIDYGGNDRIIFSGIYGIGKTYFLKEFFKDNPDYQSFFLKPVNYSVSSNKDIFEYIKYDIAFELLSGSPKYDKFKFSDDLILNQYIKNNKVSVLSSLLKNIGSVGKNVSELINSVMTLSNEFDKFKTDINVDDKKELIEFCKLFTEEKGSIYEEDFITQLIKSLVDTYEKKKVLVIDDFDRIDPEHIFRLLNVFAAHNDFNGSEQNKFGFDKIIIVCDIDNITNIYHSKYGEDVDFNGYIDKFYSMEVFVFNNKTEIINAVVNIFNSVYSKEGIVGGNHNFPAATVVVNIVKMMVNCDSINLRSLLKYSYKSYTSSTYCINSTIRFVNKNIVGFIIFDFLSSLLGSDSNLQKAIQDCTSSTFHLNRDFVDLEYFYTYLMVLAEYSKFGNTDSASTKYNNEIEYKINYNERRSYLIAELILTGEAAQKLPQSDCDIQNFLMQAFNGYKILKY